MRRFAVLLLGMLCVVSYQYGAILVLGPTTEWTPVVNPGTVSDFAGDNQASVADLDLIGDIDNSSFYIQFDNFGTLSRTDGEIGFRMRMSGDQGNPRFHGYAWVGLDADQDGAVDLFLGASDQDLFIHDAGPGANNSPSTTSIGAEFWTTSTTSANYSWTPVTLANDPTATSLDLDNEAGNDYFLTFVIPFNQLVAAVTSLTAIPFFDDTSTLSYVSGTSTNKNNINSDINGIEGGTGSVTTWTDNNGFTPEVDVEGNVVPEPSGFAALAGLAALVFFLLHKRRR